MRDPLLKGASAGLILALPVLILVASSPSTTPVATVGAALAVGPVEAILALGLWFANRSRRMLYSEEVRVAQVVAPGRSALNPGPIAG